MSRKSASMPILTILGEELFVQKAAKATKERKKMSHQAFLVGRNRRGVEENRRTPILVCRK